jgi:hypothetical protein
VLVRLVVVQLRLCRAAAGSDVAAVSDIDIAGLLDQAFADFGAPVGVRACTLIKIIPGVRVPGAVSSGTHPTTTAYQARGLIEDYSAYHLAEGLVQAGDRKVSLFGASLPRGIAPVPGDRVVFDGETMTIASNGVTTDPVKALYRCQCRR